MRVASTLAISIGLSLLVLPCVAEDPDTTHVAMGLNARGPTMCDELAIVMDSLEINNVSVDDAVHRLSAVSKRVDPDQKGMSFVVDVDAVETSRPISLSLRNVTIYDALRNICKLGNVKAKIDGSQIHIVSMRESVDEMQVPSIDQNDSHHLIVSELQTVVIDKINFKKTDIAAVLKFLAQKTRQMDPTKRGINFVAGYIAPTDGIQRQVNLTTSNVVLADLLVQLSQQTNLRYFVEDGAVYFKP